MSASRYQVRTEDKGPMTPQRRRLGNLAAKPELMRSRLFSEPFASVGRMVTVASGRLISARNLQLVSHDRTNAALEGG